MPGHRPSVGGLDDQAALLVAGHLPQGVDGAVGFVQDAEVVGREAFGVAAQRGPFPVFVDVGAGFLPVERGFDGFGAQQGAGPGVDGQLPDPGGVVQIRPLLGIPDRRGVAVLVEADDLLVFLARNFQDEGVGLLVGQVDLPEDVPDLPAFHYAADDDLLAAAVGVLLFPSGTVVAVDAEAGGLALELSFKVPEIGGGDGLPLRSRLDRQSAGFGGVLRKGQARQGFGGQVILFAVAHPGEADRRVDPENGCRHGTLLSGMWF